MEAPRRPPGSVRAGPVLLGAASAVLLALAYAPSLSWLWGRWWTDPFYSHGPLVPLVSIGLVWARRSRWRASGGALLPGVLVMAGAALLHLLGARLRFEFLSLLSLLGTLGGLALLAGGRSLLSEVGFALAFLLFAIPLPMVVIQQLSLPLELVSTKVARAALSSLGCEVARQGVLLVFPRFTLAVADACSGLRSLLSVLAIATLTAHLSAGSLARKAGMVLLSSAAAVGLNILRISLAGLIGIALGGATAALVFERYSGYVFIGLVVLSTVGLFRLLGPRPPAPEAPRAIPPPREPAPPAPARGRALAILGSLLLVTLPAALLAGRVARDPASGPPARLLGWHPELPAWRTAEVRPVGAFPGEEALSGFFEADAGRSVRWNLLHSVSGRYLHSPEACSLAVGWVPERQELDLEHGGPIHLWILRRGSERACLLFWFLQDGVACRGSLDQHLGAVVHRLWAGTVDCAYGEIVLALPIGTDPDRGRLIDLSRAFQSAVQERLWPGRPPTSR